MKNYTLERNREYISSKIPVEKLMRILVRSYEVSILHCWFESVKIVMVNALPSDAATDGENRIYVMNPSYSDIMRDLNNEELAVYVFGLVVHELFHLFWTDLKYTFRVIDDIKAGGYPKEYPNLTKLAKLSPEAVYNIAFGLCNITEDAHINRKGKKNCPLFAFPLNFVYKCFNRSLKSLNTITRDDGTVNRLGVFMEFVNYFAIRGLDPDLDGLPEDLQKLCIRSRRPIMDIVYENDARSRTDATLAYLDKVLPEIVDLSMKRGENRQNQKSQIGKDAEQASDMLDNEHNSSSYSKEKPKTVPNQKLERKPHEDKTSDREEVSGSTDSKEKEPADEKKPLCSKQESDSEAPEEMPETDGSDTALGECTESQSEKPEETESSESKGEPCGQNSSVSETDTGENAENAETESSCSHSNSSEPSMKADSEPNVTDENGDVSDNSTEDGAESFEDDFDLSDYCDEESLTESSEDSDDGSESQSEFDQSAFLDSIREELEKAESEEHEATEEVDRETNNLLEKTRSSGPNTKFEYPVMVSSDRILVKDSNGQTLLPEIKTMVNKYAAQVVRKVEREVKTRTEGGVLTHQLSGRLNGRRAMDFVTKQNLDKYRLFDKSFVGEEGLSIAAELLIDESGSMAGSKASNAVAVAAILHETCRRLGIPLRVCSYNTRTYMYCDFDEPCARSFEHRLCEYKASGCTNEAQALLLLEKSLLERPERYKYIFLVSDGQPNFSAPCGAQTWLKEYQKYCIGKGIQFVACCTGSCKEAIATIYDGPKIVYDEYDLLAQRLTKEITRSIT